jgi:ADP-ribosylglycohydrolase
MGGYGGMFTAWLYREEMGAYNSWGNGSAMRVSPVGFAFDTLEETLRVAKVSAEITHNHPEGIKGAQAVAAAIFLARNGKSKAYIREYIATEFEYNLDRSCDEIRETYHFEDSCQETVPQALIAFLESKDYEDAIRLTISLGGDADTMGAITGAVAAAYYNEIPNYLYDFTMSKVPIDLRRVIEQFDRKITEVIE